MITIKRFQKNNLFETSTKFKKLFSLISFYITFLISLYILFHINTTDTNYLENEKIKTVSFILFLLSIVWYKTTITNYNLHISYKSKWLSYILATSINIYLYFIVFSNINFVPTSWLDYRKLYFLSLGLFVINLLWRTSIIVLEYKVRPLFIKDFAVKTVLLILYACIFLFSEYATNRYFLNKEKWNYLESFNIFMIISSFLILIAIISLSFYSQVKLKNYCQKEKEIYKRVFLWNAFMRLGSISIWFISSMNKWTLTLKEIIFIIVGSVLILLMFLFLYLNIKKNNLGFYLLIWTTSVFVMNLLAYFLNSYFNANITTILAILLLFLFLYQILNILFIFKFPNFYITAYKIFNLFIIIYVLIIWISNYVIKIEISILPFNFPEFILVIFGASSLMLEFIVLYSFFIKFFKISKFSKKLYKQPKEKGVF